VIFRLTQLTVAGRLLSASFGLLLLLTSSGVYAVEHLDDGELKAAFIYNLTLFTTWPQAREDLNLCVMGKEGYFPALAKYQGRKVFNAILRVRKISSVDEVHACEVLVLDHHESPRIDRVRKALKGFPVLTVAESGISSPSTVMVLLMRDNSRETFDVNNHIVMNAGLVLSDKLLRLARKVN
jgi:hypothetical protein